MDKIKIKMSLKIMLMLIINLNLSQLNLISDEDSADTLDLAALNGTFGNDSLIKRFERLHPVDDWKDNGYFTNDYLAIINPHWLRFDPRPEIQHYSLAILYTVIMCFGITGNFLVIFLFARSKALRTPANILVVNLACSDLLMMLKMPIFVYNSIYLGPALGDKICRFYGFVGGISGTCSICTITAISLDRFYVVRYPLKNRFSSQRAKFCVTFCWLYSGSFAIIPLLDVGYGKYVPEGFLTSCSFDYLTDEASAIAFIWLFAIGAYFLPIALITFFYWSIVRVVLQKKPPPGHQRGVLTGRESQRHMRLEDKRKQELRVTLVVFSVIILWILAWTPYSIVALLGILGYKDIINPLGSMIPALFCKSASCCDPFIYALTHPKFKAELRQFCCRNTRHRIRRSFVTRTYISSRGEGDGYYDHPSGESNSISNTRNLELNHIPKTSRKYWWHKPRFNGRSRSWTSFSRSFRERRRSSSERIKQQRQIDDGVEEIVLGNLKPHEEYI